MDSIELLAFTFFNYILINIFVICALLIWSFLNWKIDNVWKILKEGFYHRIVLFISFIGAIVLMIH